MFNEMKRNKMNSGKSKQSLQSIQTKRNNLKYSFIVSYYLLLKLPLNNCLKRIFNKVKLVFFIIRTDCEGCLAWQTLSLVER